MGRSDKGARAIHAEGRGESDRFVAVNCAGVPADLMESEFFGHTEGAFTGASRERRGLFDAAHGGTLMLDEVGAMPPALQSKLLRVLEGGRVRSVGSNREREVEVRIIAATNRDLREDVEGGHFREDLYYRLEAFTVSVPPLRERGDDVDLLLAHFLGLFSARAEKRVVGFSLNAMLLLQRYPYPGNVRELRNVVERAVAYASGERIQVEDLPERVRSGDSGGSTVLDVPPPVLEAGDDVLPTLRDVEDRYIRHVLEHVDGNKRRAAALLGIARRTLYRRLSGDGE